MELCGRKSFLHEVILHRVQRMLTRYKVVVEKQAFPKSSAGLGLLRTPAAQSDNDNMTETS